MEEYNYPLEDCKDCTHNKVCKYIEVIAALKDETDLPLDFDTTACTEYTGTYSEYSDIDEDADELPRDPEEWAEHLMKSLLKGVADVVKQGVNPETVIMSSLTLSELSCHTVDRISLLQTDYGTLTIQVDEDMDDYMFMITGDPFDE